MDKYVDVKNIEIWENCMLNINTCEKVYYKSRNIKEVNGFYHRDDANFLALYPTLNGPIIYYEGVEYPVTKELHIYVKKEGKLREFFVDEYNIHICYKESKYLNFDVWSTEMDVDLYWMISQSYREDEFYKRYTKNVYNLINIDEIEMD